MNKVESFVFFDIETTGLPWQEQNRTKITELSFLATRRHDIMETSGGCIPFVSKLTMVFNPQKKIHPDVVKMNGLSNSLLKYAPVFGNKISTIVSFLQELPKPVCLVAHNGNIFDYKILLAEFQDANASFPNDILGIDSLVGFKKIIKDDPTLNIGRYTTPRTEVLVENELITDDEDEWPELDVSTEDWDDIDKLCDSLSDVSCDSITTNQSVEKCSDQKRSKKLSRSDVVKNVFNGDKKPLKHGFSLGALYKRLLNEDPVDSHRAEGDCLMLLKCVVVAKDAFIPWVDGACKRLTDIQPLVRK